MTPETRENTISRTPGTPLAQNALRGPISDALAGEAAVHLLHGRLVGTQEGSAVGPVLRVPTTISALCSGVGCVIRPGERAVRELDIVILMLTDDIERVWQRPLDREVVAVVDGVAVPLSGALGGRVNGSLAVVNKVDDTVEVG